MKHASLGLLLLGLGACGTTELQRKEATINTALASAYVACTAALNDPRITWEEGARDYCLRVVNQEPAPCAQP